MWDDVNVSGSGSFVLSSQTQQLSSFQGIGINYGWRLHPPSHTICKPTIPPTQGLCMWYFKAAMTYAWEFTLGIKPVYIYIHTIYMYIRDKENIQFICFIRKSEFLWKNSFLHCFKNCTACSYWIFFDDIFLLPFTFSSHEKLVFYLLVTNFQSYFSLPFYIVI